MMTELCCYEKWMCAFLQNILPFVSIYAKTARALLLQRAIHNKDDNYNYKV